MTAALDAAVEPYTVELAAATTMSDGSVEIKVPPSASADAAYLEQVVTVLPSGACYDRLLGEGLGMKLRAKCDIMKTKHDTARPSSAKCVVSPLSDLLVTASEGFAVAGADPTAAAAAAADAVELVAELAGIVMPPAAIEALKGVVLETKEAHDAKFAAIVAALALDDDRYVAKLTAAGADGGAAAVKVAADKMSLNLKLKAYAKKALSFVRASCGCDGLDDDCDGLVDDADVQEKALRVLTALLVDAFHRTRDAGIAGGTYRPGDAVMKPADLADADRIATALASVACGAAAGVVDAKTEVAAANLATIFSVVDGIVDDAVAADDADPAEPVGSRFRRALAELEGRPLRRRRLFAYEKLLEEIVAANELSNLINDSQLVNLTTADVVAHAETFNITIVYGCTNALAENYNSDANHDVGSDHADACIILGCTNSNTTNYNADATNDDGSCIYPIDGCTDETALNYKSAANNDDGSCIARKCGCMDTAALNYAVDANTNNATLCNGDEACDYEVPVPGCMDVNASNFYSAATVSNSSCTYVVLGCTDATARNFDASHTQDTEPTSCEYFATAAAAVAERTAHAVDAGGARLHGRERHQLQSRRHRQ